MTMISKILKLDFMHLNIVRIFMFLNRNIDVFDLSLFEAEYFQILINVFLGNKMFFSIYGL